MHICYLFSLLIVPISLILCEQCSSSEDWGGGLVVEYEPLGVARARLSENSSAWAPLGGNINRRGTLAPP